jgi:hypothetical protein
MGWIPHLYNLLARAGLTLLNEMGTTLLAVGVGLVVTFGPFLGAFLAKIRASGFGKTVKESFKLGGLVTVGAWVLLFAWAIMATVYRDHNDLVSRGDHLQAEKTALEGELREATAPKCWLADNRVFPNKNIPTAQTAIQAILYCNRKFDTPVEVTVEFDRAIMQGNLTVAGAGVMSASAQTTGRLFRAVINSPPVIAYQLVVVTVQAESTEYPHAVRSSMTTLR